jgi:hypothetical protein
LLQVAQRAKAVHQKHMTVRKAIFQLVHRIVEKLLTAALLISTPVSRHHNELSPNLGLQEETNLLHGYVTVHEAVMFILTDAPPASGWY